MPVEPKAFRVLLFLLRNPGRLVTKDEIRKLSGVIVRCRTTPSRAVSQRCEGCSKTTPVSLATSPLCPRLVIDSFARLTRRKKTLGTPISSGLVQSGTRNEEVSKGGTSHGSGFSDSIAVLPFENAGDDPEMDYLSDGMTVSIIRHLSQVHRLRVVPRTTVSRYKGKLNDLAQAGRELHVRVVLTGRVSQRGDAMSINVELIDTAHESQLWGAHFNGNAEDIFRIQAEIAAQVTNKLKLELNHKEREKLAKRPTASREAYHLLLKSLYWANKWTPDGIQKGVDYARQAIDVDPVYAEAWTALAYLFVHRLLRRRTIN